MSHDCIDRCIALSALRTELSELLGVVAVDSFGAWRALSARVEGILSAVIMWAEFGPIANTSQAKRLYAEMSAIVHEFDRFIASASNDFPPAAIELLKDARLRKILTDAPNLTTVHAHVSEVAIIFKVILTNIEYLLADTDAVLRQLTERAFLHLQWLIYADKEVRARWQSAFAEGEPACEKLGASHLLWHAIYSFKAKMGAITDCVLGEPIDMTTPLPARGLVLTEWKRANQKDVSVLVEDAIGQAEMYVSGVLGMTELRTRRYIVIVSENQISMPPDVQKGDVIYRAVNVAASPLPPSKAAVRVGRNRVS